MRITNQLTAAAVKATKKPGLYADGLGLYLQVAKGGSKTWIFRYQRGAKSHKMGLGSVHKVSLKLAREKVAAQQLKLLDGVDPIKQRKAKRAAEAAEQGRNLTFSKAVDRYLAAKLDAFKNAKHRAQWKMTLQTYACPELGSMLVSDITVQDVLRVLEPIWRTKTETATRLRGRIEAVLSWATVAGHRTGDNPARWVGSLKELLPASSKVKKGDNQPAVQLDDAARWFKALRGREGTGSRALEFLTLTACRSGEVRGATWDEIDLEKALWIVPAARMKMRREHRVPLTGDAVALLKALPRFADSPFVFPAARGGQLSDMTLSAAMRRIHDADIATGAAGFIDRLSKRPAVPHGLRSTFRDWVAERTTHPGEMAEVALAHKISNAVEAAYRRGDMVEKRRRLMTDWADFCAARSKGKAKGAAGNVVPIRAA